MHFPDLFTNAWTWNKIGISWSTGLCSETYTVGETVQDTVIHICTKNLKYINTFSNLPSWDLGLQLSVHEYSRHILSLFC